ncbi:MAG: AzlD domain-containing protein [Beijerinckiaceae bacterium]
MSGSGAEIGGTIGPWTVIAATALVTYLLRVTGYLVMARVPLTPRVKRALEALPASIFISTVVPIALRSGAAGISATLAAGIAMYFTKREIPALAAGFAVAAGMRAAGL